MDYDLRYFRDSALGRAIFAAASPYAAAAGAVPEVRVGELLPWTAGQPAVLSELDKAADLATYLSGGLHLAVYLLEIRRVVAGWDPETFQMAVDLATVGVAPGWEKVRG